MTIKEALSWAKKILIECEVAEPESSAEFLLRQVLNLDRAKLYVSQNKKLSLFEESKFKKYIKRRLKHEPVWQIVGKVEFYGLDFYVNKNVLVPRPETEFLVERVLKEVKNTQLKIKNRKLKICDVGTGAAPIICALALNINNAEFFASDVSGEALLVARKIRKT